MLTDEDVDIQYGHDLLGCSSSEALINTIWLNNTQLFGLRGCQEHRDMRWGDVERKETAEGTAFLEFNERQTKTRTGADPKDSRAVKPKRLLSKTVKEILFGRLTSMLLKDQIT